MLPSNTPTEIDQLNQEAWEIRITDTPRSLELSRAALKAAEKQDYIAGKASAKRTIGFCMLRMSNYSEALGVLKESLIQFQLVNDQRGEATVYEYIGIIQRNFGEMSDSLISIQKAINISRETNFIENEITNLYQLGVTYRNLGLPNKALEALYKSLNLARKENFELMIGYNLNVIGSLHYESGEFEKALENFQEGLVFREKSGDEFGIAGSFDNIGSAYLKLGSLEKAASFFHQSFQLSRKIGNKKSQINTLIHLAEIQKKENPKAAIALLNESLIQAKQIGDVREEVRIYLQIADIRRGIQQGEDQSEILATLEKTLSIAKKTEAVDLIADSLYMLYQLHKSSNKYERALEYLEMHLQHTRSLHRENITHKIQSIETALQAEQSRKEIEIFQIKNNELERLNQETSRQKKEIEKTLKRLEKTQSQLIHAEKMSSLGQLTAGIAHEIKNPLNFVNNFAEMNEEMLDDLIELIQDAPHALEIAKDLKENAQRIQHHGKRADDIVRTMLQHSRTSTFEKEDVDVNELCEEYIELAYHGMQNLSKSHVDIQLDYEANLPRISVMKQEIGRVLLNIINNALQALNDDTNTKDKSIKITTKKQDQGNIMIAIRDNGPGIPEKVKKKIFEPFFTTKPTNEGTGLGLSLSYDIIKAHGGSIEVDSEVGEGTTFIIILPK